MKAIQELDTDTIKKLEGKYKSVGIDGCDGGWMVAMRNGSRLSIERYKQKAGRNPYSNLHLLYLL